MRWAGEEVSWSIMYKGEVGWGGGKLEHHVQRRGGLGRR